MTPHTYSPTLHTTCTHIFSHPTHHMAPHICSHPTLTCGRCSAAFLRTYSHTLHTISTHIFSHPAYISKHRFSHPTRRCLDWRPKGAVLYCQISPHINSYTLHTTWHHTNSHTLHTAALTCGRKVQCCISFSSCFWRAANMTSNFLRHNCRV